MQPEHRTDAVATAMRADAPPNTSSNGDGHDDASRRLRGNGHGGHEDAVPADLPKIGAGAVVVITLVIAVLLGALFLLGWRPHERRLAEANHEAADAASAKPIVDVTRPHESKATIDVVLPGDVQADQSTAVFARTSGYLKPLPPGIDIGARVKAGQLIAEIAAPEVDAELTQAKAALDQADVAVGRATKEANYQKGTFERYEGLSKSGGVTPQQLEEKRAAFLIANSSLKAAEAAVKVAAASVERLTAQTGFQKVVAPFDGTITARNYDAGALISATGTAPGRELFRIDHTDTLRVHVNVPQGYATDVKLRQDAELLVRNYPGQAFVGSVARVAGAIDPATRTMRVEVDIPNKDGRLFPGMYGQVRFKVKRERPALVLPTSALVFGVDGMRTVVLDGTHVHYRPVVVGRDFGSEAEISSGITADDQVVTNPGEHLTDGAEVRVNAPPATKVAAAAPTTRQGAPK